MQFRCISIDTGRWMVMAIVFMTMGVIYLEWWEFLRLRSGTIDKLK